MTDRVKIFEHELLLISDPTIRAFTLCALELLPNYFFEIPASSSGKFHPAYALGKGGLVRHTIAAVNIAACMFDNTTICGRFTQRHKDLIVSALLLHDGLKGGSEYKDCTVAEHPVLVTQYLREVVESTCPKIYFDTMNEVFPLIESHMGQWNTNKDGKVITPLPKNGPASYVHMCDYLASRKLIDINFEACSH